MDIKLDSDAMRVIVQNALLQSLDQQKRDTLITAALEHLLKPQRSGGYGTEEVSPLERAFRDALQFTAREIANDMVKTDEVIRDKIRGLLNAAVEKAMGERLETIAEKLGLALEKALTGRDY